MEVLVPSFAKLNLSLLVLYKRPDGFHELRSVFQTISLADRIRIRVRRARETKITFTGNVDIPDNLIVRAAGLCLEELRMAAAVEFELDKRIPMGAGLGGGSSNAATVLTVLPQLAGKEIPLERRMALAAQLGSDVPFFLLGGTAAVLGRGEELYPLADARGRYGLVVSPGIHVSTPQAYRALSARLTRESVQPKIARFQAALWSGSSPSENDFEPVVFEQHPRLKEICDQLRGAGAAIAMMTGSGSSIFGMFESKELRDEAAGLFPEERTFRIRFVTRAQYRSTRD